MITLLSALLFVYLGLEIGKIYTARAERWFVQLHFSIYLGWITVATIANVSDLLDFVKWGQFGISDEIWMVIILVVVAVIGWAMSLRRRDIAYLAVLLWALAGIGIKFPQTEIVTTSV